MAASGNDGTEGRLDVVATEPAGFTVPSPSRSIRQAIAIHRRGPRSLVNLSLYAAGLSGMWTAFGTPLLPIKIEEILAGGGSQILGFTFDESNKNGALGLVSLIGLVAAALTQPLAGILSDRRRGPARRLPYLLVGTFGMAASVMFLGFVGTLIALILLNILIQGTGNFGQGSANGLIADHVGKGSKGTAAGALNLSRVLGAGILTGIVLLMMGQYDVETSPGWMTGSLALMATVAVLTTLWTVTSLRRASGETGAEAADVLVETEEVEPEVVSSDETGSDTPRENYLRFLIALTVAIAGFSALQLYAFFYLADVIGLENPAEGALVVLVAIAVATSLTVLPAGRLADRIGRDPMLIVGGSLGVVASLILIFAGSMVVVALVGLMIGVVIGIFLTVSWALANDLVSRRHAARDLGYASIAALIGSSISRISGLGVDRLNQIDGALGYQVVLGAVALSFIISVLLMTRLSSGGEESATDSLAEQPVAD